MNDLSVARRIKKIMEQQRITQKGLSEFLGISQPAVSLYLQGRMPPADVLHRISQLGNTTMEWLLTGRRTEKSQDKIAESAAHYGNQEILMNLWNQLPQKIQQNIISLLRQIVALKSAVLVIYFQ